MPAAQRVPGLGAVHLLSEHTQLGGQAREQVREAHGMGCVVRGGAIAVCAAGKDPGRSNRVGLHECECGGGWSCGARQRNGRDDDADGRFECSFEARTQSQDGLRECHAAVPF